MTKLAVKVDVDTLRGYKEGVPNLLDLFKRHSLHASIFFSFGPDNSGKAIRRIFRRGFVSKMLRTKAPSTYGLKTLLYGTLLPAPPIVESDPAIFAKAAECGHDCGVHAWDHVYTQDKLGRISKVEFIALFEKAAEMFERFTGERPRSYAAPGWQVSAESLGAQEDLMLEYCSDVRGYSPFLPVFEGREFSVPQIPTTLPTMDEIYGLHGINDETIPSFWLRSLDKEWNVLTVHAEMEGISKLFVFEKFIRMAMERGTEILTLRDYARQSRPKRCAIRIGTVRGRAGTLALQEEAKNG